MSPDQETGIPAKARIHIMPGQEWKHARALPASTRG